MTAVVLDISCAFLNARLERSPDAKPVLIQPPSILYKLGLLEKGFFFSPPETFRAAAAVPVQAAN